MSEPRGDVQAMLASYIGQPRPGGCDDCDAEQEMTAGGDGVFTLNIRHEDGCPWLARYERRRA